MVEADRSRIDRRSTGVVVKLQKQCGEDSDRWFGDTQVTRDLAYHALCLCGEAGEFANLVKKAARGSIDPSTAIFRHDLAMELADVFTYLLNIGDILQIDLEATYHVKRDYNNQRFTAERITRTSDHADVDGVRQDDSGEARDGSEGIRSV